MIYTFFDKAMSSGATPLAYKSSIKNENISKN